MYQNHARSIHYCKHRTCKNTSQKCGNISFFRFPKDSVRFRLWAIISGREEFLEEGSVKCHNKYRLCAIHFEERMFLNDLKNRLHLHSIPKLQDDVQPFLSINYDQIVKECQEYAQKKYGEYPFLLDHLPIQQNMNKHSKNEKKYCHTALEKNNPKVDILNVIAWNDNINHTYKLDESLEENTELSKKSLEFVVVDDVKTRSDLLHNYCEKVSYIGPQILPVGQKIVIDYQDEQIIWKYQNESGELIEDIQEDICCICVENKENLINISDMDAEDTIINKLRQSFMELELKLDEVYQSVCEKCREDIKHVYKFKKICEDSYGKLQNYKEKILRNKLQNSHEEMEEDDPVQIINEVPEVTIISENVEESEVIAGFSKYACPFCSLQFNSLRDVHYHKLTDHIKEKKTYAYKILEGSLSNNFTSKSYADCDICSKILPDETKLKDHQKNHRKLFNCDICGKPYPTKRGVEIHKASHEPVAKFKCAQCNKKFKSSLLIKLHQKKHIKSEKFYECEQCAEKFKRKYDYNRHLKNHDYRPHKCDVCSKSFKYKVGLREHMRLHSNERPYMCEQCGLNFTHAEKLRKHRIMTHIKVRNFQCTECSKQFFFNSNLRRHMLTHTGKPQFICEECGKMFLRKKSLTQHIDLVHKNVRNFECSVCGKRFKQRHHLQHHQEIHEVVKYQCEKCLRTFSHKSTLFVHYNQKHGPMSFSCPKCNKGFAKEEAFKKHVCNLICKICDKSWNRKTNLIKHMKKKHNLDFTENDLFEIISDNEFDSELRKLNMLIDVEEKT